MKRSMLVRIMLVTTLLAIYLSTAIAEQENQTDNFAIVQDIYNNSSTSDMPSPSNITEIFDIPGFSNLTSNMTANYYYSKGHLYRFIYKI
jgi:hypothetical protein